MTDTRTQCVDCGADWTAGHYSGDCSTCGGGALERECPWCAGICGQSWKRALSDSQDQHEAHWIGHCDLISPSAAATKPRTLPPAAEWWLDESALPTLIWAAVVDVGTHVLVVDADGRGRVFSDRTTAGHWLREDEYESFDDLLSRGSVPAGTQPPRQSGPR